MNFSKTTTLSQKLEKTFGWLTSGQSVFTMIALMQLCNSATAVAQSSSSKAGRSSYAPQSYHVTGIDLGSYGERSVRLTGINDHGHIVGEATDNNFFEVGFIWTPDSIRILDLNSALGGNDNGVDAINNNGWAVGSYEVDGVGSRGALWQNGNRIDLGGLIATGYSPARDINNSGQIVGSARVATGNSRAYLWQNGSLLDLGTLPGHERSFATAINETGDIVGGSYTSATASMIFQNGSMFPLANITGASHSAIDINDQGQIIGQSRTGNVSSVYLWQNGAGTIISEGTPVAINDSSQIVFTLNNRAYLWENNVATDLNTLIADSAWVLQAAADINNAGQIVGSGLYDGKSLGFLLGPTITLTRPVAEELWIAGEKDTIKWDAGPDIARINISYSTNWDGSSGTFSSIESNYPADSMRFVWDVPDGLLSRNVTIMLQETIQPFRESLSEPFYIKGYELTRIAITASDEFERFAPAKHGWSFSNSGNNLWPQAWWLQFDYTGTDPVTGRGYSSFFEDFDSHRFPDWPLFVQIVGTDASYWTLSPVVLYSYSGKLKWEAIGRNWKGSCTGFAISSLLAFGQTPSFYASYATIEQNDMVNQHPLSNEVRLVLNDLQPRQFLAPHTGTLGLKRNYTAKQTVEDIKRMFLSEARLDDAYLYLKRVTSGAHAVVPYRIDPLPAIADTVIVWVYDPNAPGQEKGIKVDTVRNAWFYNTNYNGSGGFYLVDRANGYLSQPSFAASEDLLARAVHRTNLDFYNTSRAHISITNVGGQRIGYADSLVFNEIVEAEPIVPNTGYFAEPIGYTLPQGDYSIAIGDFSTDVSYFSVFTENRIWSYSRRDALSSQMDELHYAGGLAMCNRDAEIKTVNLSATGVSDDEEHHFNLSSLQMVSNDSMRFSIEADDDLRVVNAGGAKSYELLLAIRNASGGLDLDYGSISLNENTAHVICPNWQDMENEAVEIFVDEGNDGTVDDTLSVEGVITSVLPSQSASIPTDFSLSQNYPNPFNASTTIQFSLPKDSFVSLKIFDIKGRLVDTLLSEKRNAGEHKVTFNARDLSSGVYFYEFRAGSYKAVKKLLLIK